MSWTITGAQKTLNGTLAIGQAVGGGYFAGYISHTADGNPTHALIVAPRATGASGTGYPLLTGGVAKNFEWALNQNAGNGTNYSSTTIGATTPAAAKDYDGLSNIALMTAIGISNFPAAEFCKNLSIGGFTDWYLPARYELEIAYYNFKPTSDANVTNQGANIYAVPQRNGNYTSATPSQTLISAFNTSSERFEADGHWSSTEIDSSNARYLMFNSGEQNNIFSLAKSGTRRTRAFRRIAL